MATEERHPFSGVIGLLHLAAARYAAVALQKAVPSLAGWVFFTHGMALFALSWVAPRSMQVTMWKRWWLLAAVAAGTMIELFVRHPDTRAWSLPVVLLLGLSIVTLSLLWSAGQRLDIWIFLLFNLRGFHPIWMDRAMWVLTQVGNGVFGLLLCAVFYFTGLRRLAIEMLAGILTLWLCVEIFKALAERSRPYQALEGTRVIGWRERGLSFPSGHTAQTFFMVTFLVQSFETGVLLVAVSYLLAVTVGFTRIYVGAHYPRDVLGGAILGSVWGILSILAGGYLL